MFDRFCGNDMVVSRCTVSPTVVPFWYGDAACNAGLQEVLQAQASGPVTRRPCTTRSTA
jgi:hypothetical protein